MPHYSPEYDGSRARWNEPRHPEDRDFERDVGSRRGRFASSRPGRFRDYLAYGRDFDVGPRNRFEGEFGEGGWRGRSAGSRRGESGVAGRWYGTVYSAEGRNRAFRRPREFGGSGNRSAPYDTRARRYGSAFSRYGTSFGRYGTTFGRYGRELGRQYGREYGGFGGPIGAWGAAHRPGTSATAGYGQPLYGARGAGLDYSRDFFGGYIAGRYGGGTTGGTFGVGRTATDSYDIAFRNFRSSRFAR